MVTRVIKQSSWLTIGVVWWNMIKSYLAVGLLGCVCTVMGFAAGSVYIKARFDQAAIKSGHAQYHPTKGTIEWRVCK